MSKSPFGLILGLALLSMLVTGPAAAQVPMPPPQKHSCEAPGEYPMKIASDATKRSWTRAANAYLECLKKFIKDQEALAKPYVDAAKVHLDAGNAAIAEHNQAVKTFTEAQGEGSN